MGEKQSFKASVPETASTEVYEVHWSGEFENGRFVQGNNYTMTVRLRIKASSSNVLPQRPRSMLQSTDTRERYLLFVNIKRYPSNIHGRNLAVRTPTTRKLNSGQDSQKLLLPTLLVIPTMTRC